MKSKQKTRKAALKRFKITKKGKILHRGHGMRHLRSNKKKKRLRSLKKDKAVIGKFKTKLKKMMGV